MIDRLNPDLFIRVALGAALVVCSAACATSIHHRFDLSHQRPSIVSIDAKQRGIIMSPVTVQSGGTTNSLLRFCSEPPPDVFTALASSFGASLDFARPAGAPAPQVAASISRALSENATTIERSQTINILREAMFRTCERYLNGAIGETEFIVQAARDQQVMVATLAIEQITGLQRAKSAALTTAANAATSGVSTKSLELLDAAKRAAEAAKAAATAKRKEAEEAQPTDVDCPTALKSTNDAHAPKKALCEEAASLESEQQTAEDYYTTIKKAVDAQIETSATADGRAFSEAAVAAAVNDQIADRVVAIVQEVSDFDEIGMTCVVIFRLIADGKINLDELGTDLKRACVDRVSAEARLTAAQMDQRRAEIQQRLESLYQGSASIIFDSVFDSATGRVDANKLDALIQRAGVTIVPADRNAIVGATNREQFVREITKLGHQSIQALAEAARNQTEPSGNPAGASGNQAHD